MKNEIQFLIFFLINPHNTPRKVQRDTFRLKRSINKTKTHASIHFKTISKTG